MGLFDVHAHLTSPRLAQDEAAILDRARQAGLTTIVSNGLNPADNEAVRQLARRAPDLVRPAFGLYPVDAVLPEMLAMGIEYPREDVAAPATAEEGIAWIEDHIDEAFAIGEIGLDGYWVPEPLWARQEEVFRRLVSLAMEADKPIIIHTRKRERRAFEILVEMGATRVNWHCFGSKVKLARRIAEHGHWMSIPANVEKAESFTRMVETLPRERILLETDCPYLAPVRGERNEPANVTVTHRFIARRWGCTEDEVTRRMEDNFTALFGVPP